MSKKYVTVTALTKYLKKKLDIDPHLRDISLRGEISNFIHHSSGHMYFTIKDNYAQIRAVMFASHNRQLPFTPKNGAQIVAKGEVSIYERHGGYQFYVKGMEPDGIGALYLAYEQLKEKLKKARYFDPMYKKALPKYPKHVGVITSPKGAAVKDIITTIKRRYPIVNITIIPVQVQGEGAGKSIVLGIEKANELNMFDTLIVGRGGGSIEDLWAFNEEQVVKAIFHSSIPIINAVGHETDTTLSDFVADVRASTPTGAAELAVPSLLDVKQSIKEKQVQLVNTMKLYINERTKSLQQLQTSYGFHLPKQFIMRNEQYIDSLFDKMNFHFRSNVKKQQTTLHHAINQLQLHHPNDKINQFKNTIQNYNEQLIFSTKNHLEKQQYELSVLLEKLTLLNPLHTIKRGYAIPYKEDDTILKTVKKVKQGDRVSLRLIDGKLDTKVTYIQEEK